MENTCTLTAPNGTAGLAAGYEVLVRDGAQDGGKFAVKVGGADTEARTSGRIKAASAELRANGGNVYALAGDTKGVIAAIGTATRDGRIYLTAEDGAVEAGGTITAMEPAATCSARWACPRMRRSGPERRERRGAHSARPSHQPRPILGPCGIGAGRCERHPPPPTPALPNWV
ncbi:hypothetical protein [Xanthobacter sediminis]